MNIHIYYVYIIFTLRNIHINKQHILWHFVRFWSVCMLQAPTSFTKSRSNLPVHLIIHYIFENWHQSLKIIPYILGHFFFFFNSTLKKKFFITVLTVWNLYTLQCLCAVCISFNVFYHIDGTEKCSSGGSEFSADFTLQETH